MDVLFKNKYHIIHTNTAETGLALIHDIRIDAVLTEDRLSGNLSGLGLLKILKYEGDSTPVIIFADKDIKQAANHWGAKWFIQKPFIGQEMQLIVSTIIDTNNAEGKGTRPGLSLQLRTD